MPTCPRCQTLVPAEAVQCPQCRLTLKAHGHPGIPLHQATGTTYLCGDCVYHQDDTCTFPQRPQATSCTLYVSEQGIAEEEQWAATRPSPPLGLNSFVRRYGAWLLLGLLLGVSFLLAVF